MSRGSFWDQVLNLATHLSRCTYYHVLGVAPTASADEISAAFYRLAPHLHPDRHATERDPRRVRAINLVYARMREGYTVLLDPVTRRAYDAGVADGVLRYDAHRDDVKKPTISGGKARQFYEMGQERLRVGDVAAARMQFQMAAQLEPNNPQIEKALAETQPRNGAPASAATSHQSPPAAPASQPATVTFRKTAPEGERSLRDTATLSPTGRGMQTPGQQPGSSSPPVNGPTRENVDRESSPRSAARAFAMLVASSPVADAIGIDFGTSYSSASVGIGDELFVIPDPYGRTLQPSVVHYRDNGLAACGWDAREMLISRPRHTIASPKRLLGRKASDPTVAGLLQSASYKTLDGPNDSILVDVEGRHYAIGQVCSQVVTHIREIAERQLGRRIDKAVMTVPVTYAEARKNEVRRIAQMAGIEVLDLIEEPVAAAMAYGFGHGKDEIVAVYDFGGGTFDFTVLDINGYSFSVLARGGDSWLGGDDFDLALASAVADAVWRMTKVELRNRAVEWQRVLFAAEQTKRQLSTLEVARIVVDKLIEHPTPMNLRQKISRGVFEKLTAELVQRSLAICRSTLAQAGLDPLDMHQIVVSGGVSRIPFVRRELSAFFGREITPVVNPDEAICVGAGFRAAQLCRFPVKGLGTAR